MQQVLPLLKGLNDAQARAVTFSGAPLLVLAGAGSGKTRVLTRKIAWLISEKEVLPWKVLAVTFTNKAAREMRERVESLLGHDLSGMQVLTFHSFGLQMLFRCRNWLADRGYAKNFVVYDRADSLSVIKRAMKDLDVDDEQISPAWVMEQVSHIKDSADPNAPDALDSHVKPLYEAYQTALKEQGAFDFDDLISMPLRMLSADSDLLAKERKRLDWVLVDEYQDVNRTQYQLMRKLAGTSPNLMAVGDPDQSIYGWRGADVSTILNFERDFPGAKVMLLEQNYRSTDKILAASNAVIRHNESRRKKELWTSRSDGSLPEVWVLPSEHYEAGRVADTIEHLTAEGFSYGDMAILYRVNAMSRTYEQTLLERRMPYRIVRGTGFYDRKEIRDVISYMRLAVNPYDRASLERIGNLPARGLGPKGLTTLGDFIAVHREADPADVWQRVKNEKGGLSGKAGEGAVQLGEALQNLLDRQSNLSRVIDWIMEGIGYEQVLQKADPDDWEDRYDNVRELQSVAPEGDDLADVLAQVSLYTDADARMGESGDVVNLLSLHAAKGLEFPVVFMVGMEEGIFPHSRSSEAPDQMEEERRLCYVGMTRAEEKLYMSGVHSRRMFGTMLHNGLSRFLGEIPDDLKHTVEVKDDNFEFNVRRRPYRGSWSW